MGMFNNKLTNKKEDINNEFLLNELNEAKQNIEFWNLEFNKIKKERDALLIKLRKYENNDNKDGQN